MTQTYSPSLCASNNKSYFAPHCRLQPVRCAANLHTRSRDCGHFFLLDVRFPEVHVPIPNPVMDKFAPGWLGRLAWGAARLGAATTVAQFRASYR